MIDNVYHLSRTPMRHKHSTSRKLSQETPTEWSAQHNPHVRKLLDLVAKELADEYVRLIRGAEDERSPAKAATKKRNR